MSIFKYVTNRQVKNKAGEDTGRMKLFVKKDSELAEGEYTCPECRHNGKINDPWVKPFAIKCEKCNITIKLPKLLKQFKKEKKKEVKKEN
ncbi:MAG: hypothetical protein ABIH52_00155 [Candidatus Aenigmatarchaeota archaeon]